VRGGRGVLGCPTMSVTTIDKVIAMDKHRSAGNLTVIRRHVPMGHHDPLGDEPPQRWARFCRKDGECLDSSAEKDDNLLCPRGHWTREWQVARVGV
jgi:hypothetical protein